MYLKQIVVACLATALTSGAMAQQLTLKSGCPETYVVQKGTPSGISRASIWPNPGSGHASGTSIRRSPIPLDLSR